MHAGSLFVVVVVAAVVVVIVVMVVVVVVVFVFVVFDLLCVWCCVLCGVVWCGLE